VETCLICRIVRGEAAGTVLHRDERLVAFRDLNPMAPFHALVVPVKHLASINDAEPSDATLLGEMLLLAKRIARQEALSEDGYRLVINTGAAAGQSVQHVHMHMLAGRQMSWPPG
jgi:histidine triad (HIT) family protein